MKISKIEIKNFRILRDISVDLEENLSLVIGKNNCGKTSLLTLLDKFIGKKSNTPSFSFDDLNLDAGKVVKGYIEGVKPLPDDLPFLGIRLRLFITYDEADNLANVGDTILMDLDPENNTMVLTFDYAINKAGLEKAKKDFEEANARREHKGQTSQSSLEFLASEHRQYFRISRKSHLFDLSSKKPDETKFTDLDQEKIKLDKILSFRTIGARREVSNKDSDKTLSNQSALAYERISSANGEAEAIENFKDSLVQADSDLSEVYDDLFRAILDDISRFGGVKPDETTLKIVSSLQSAKLLKDNTIVKYTAGDDLHDLPESHNGLGYLNLISMIFDLAALMNEFSGTELKPPADINLLFIEEPEAHTHPQLQYIFIKNIKNLLARYSTGVAANHKFKLQTILSTHSSHIVSESDFEDIKFFRRSKDNVDALNLGDLAEIYKSDTQAFKFLKQYLTIHRSELFFADKAIFIEGDTEQVILPAMITKVDQEIERSELNEDSPISIPLNSQNVSIVEVGNYFQTFEKFVRFIGLKSLVITDIDGVKTVPVLDDNGDPKLNQDGSPKSKIDPCKTSEAERTSNSVLRQFFVTTDDDGKAVPLPFNDLRSLSDPKKLFKPSQNGWVQSETGNLRFAYQTEETNLQSVTYHARSFEDAFFHVNRLFFEEHCIENGKFNEGNIFASLTNKHLKVFFEDYDPYTLAEKGVGSKPSLAIEVLLGSTETDVTVTPHESHQLPRQIITHYFANWNVPKYIKDGLIWLRQE